jgi:uncharacterized RDD family membrane protein YckC
VPPQPFSDWWTRAGAFLIDQLIVVGVAVALGLAAALLTDDPTGRSGEIAIYAIAIAVSGLYAPLLMARSGARNGQTIGKQVVGIRVVRTDGAPVGFGVGFLRTVVAQQLLTAITFYLYALADYLWPLRDRRNQALHDKIARTWVVQATAATAAPPSPFGAPPTDPPLPVPDPDEVPVQGWLPPRSPRG